MSEPIIYIEFKDADSKDPDESLTDIWIYTVPRVGDFVRLEPDWDQRWVVVEVDWSIEHDPPGTPRRAMVQCFVRRHDA